MNKIIAPALLITAYTTSAMAMIDPQQAVTNHEPQKSYYDYLCNKAQILYLPEDSRVGLITVYQCATNSSSELRCDSVFKAWMTYGSLSSLSATTRQLEIALKAQCPVEADFMKSHRPEDFISPMPVAR